MTRDEVIQGMIHHARSLFERNYTYSTGGNLSHRFEDGFLITATNTSFGRLQPDEFSFCDLNGEHVSGPKPSKEADFHAAVYRNKPGVNAVLHLHSPAGITLACIAEPSDAGNAVPVVTSGSITRVGRVPLIEYNPPGSEALARRVNDTCASVNAVLMQNHGLITFGATLEQAVDIAEEFEQNTRVWLATGGTCRLLDDEQIKHSKPLNGAAIAAGQQRPRLLPGVTLAGATST